MIFTGVIRKEKGGKRGKKEMEEMEKEGGELEERTEERTEERREEGTEERGERIEDTEEGLEVTEEACKEDERCEEESECHSAAKRARVCATFTDSQENAIVEFVKEHPELYNKEHGRFHDRQRKEALWAEISTELKLQPFDVRTWFESQRTRYGKLSKLQSGQAPRKMTKRQSWQPFFDYVASEAEKMTQEELEDLKGRIFRDIRESQKVGILPTTTQQASSSTQAATVPAVTSTTHPATLALETLHQCSQSRTRAADKI